MADVISVSELNHYVKTLLDVNDGLFDLALRGEIANFVQNARSGHCYFTLRDDACSVKAVMFRSDAARLAFRPQEGMRVVVRCRATLYERDGAFQLYVNAMFPDGMGAAQQMRSIEIKVANGDGVPIAAGYAEAVEDGVVLPPDEFTPFLLYIAPDQIQITDDPLTTLSFEITVTTAPA